MSIRVVCLFLCTLHAVFGYHDFTALPNVCPDGFSIQYETTLCFSIDEELLTFDEAKASCASKGGRLAELKTADVEWFIFENTVAHSTNYGQSTAIGYWIGITDTAADGTWTYASDGSPIVFTYWGSGQPDLAVGDCVMYKYSKSACWITAPCQEKARSVCQYVVPPKTCALRQFGELTPFDVSESRRLVELPCSYRLADATCGSYNVEVLGTSEVDGAGERRFSPQTVEVIVRLNGAQIWRGTANRDVIESSTDGGNLWTVQTGTASSVVSQTFNVARQAAVLNVADKAEVEFSASTDPEVNGVYVRCSDMTSDDTFPNSLCGNADFGRQRRLMGLNDKSQLFVWAILTQHAGIGNACTDLSAQLHACPDVTRAVKTCAPVFTVQKLAKCFSGQKHWFAKCLTAVCDDDNDACSEISDKVMSCNVDVDDNEYRSRVTEDFRQLLNSCPYST